MILRIIRRYLLLKAREYRNTGSYNLKHYPPQTVGREGATLLIEWGNFLRALSESFKNRR